VDIKQAKEKLDHVIAIGRVEMYKPIQVAETLRMAITSKEINLSDVESYRTKSRRWRDNVTDALFSKNSTSSARFQDDLWNPSAVPPEAMVALGNANSTNHVVEAYIYSFIVEKNQELVTARSTVSNLNSKRQIENLLAAFDVPTLKSSADRLYEILATAVFKTELSQTSYTISIDGPKPTNHQNSIDALVDLVFHFPMPLEVDRLGHTNAADAGLDIWTNFGVAVNVKRLPLNVALLDKIVKDTPIGSLHIVCLKVEPAALAKLGQLKKAGLNISVTTLKDLLNSVETLTGNKTSLKLFVDILTKSFDQEFPMAKTLGDFIKSRDYFSTPLTGLWQRKDLQIDQIL
jgi:type II restriction enzyme